MTDTSSDQIPEPVDALEPTQDDLDWERLLGAQFGDDESEEKDEDVEPPAEGGEQPSPSSERQPEEVEEETPPSAGGSPGAGETPSGVVRVAGMEVPEAELAQAVQMRAWMQAYPEYTAQFIEMLEGRLAGGEQQAAPAEKPKPRLDVPAEEDWDFVPESLKERVATYDNTLAEMQQRLEEQQRFIQQQLYAQEQQQVIEAQNAIETAKQQFRERYQIDDDEMNNIVQEAAALGVADSLAARYNDPVRGVSEALELAYLRDPTRREKQVLDTQQQALEDLRRQQKLAALNGSGGSAPRTESQPSTPDGRREAMVREIRAALYGNG